MLLTISDTTVAPAGVGVDDDVELLGCADVIELEEDTTVVEMVPRGTFAVGCVV